MFPDAESRSPKQDRKTEKEQIMANKQLSGLKEGLKKAQGRTIISAVGNARKIGDDKEKVHAHF